MDQLDAKAIERDALSYVFEPIRQLQTDQRYAPSQNAVLAMERKYGTGICGKWLGTNETIFVYCSGVVIRPQPRITLTSSMYHVTNKKGRELRHASCAKLQLLLEQK